MLKRWLSAVLAIVLVFSTAVVAGAYDDNFEGKVGIRSSILETELKMGTTYDFLLSNYDSGGAEHNVDSRFMNDYKVTATLTEGRSYASVSLVKKSSVYYLRVITKESSSKNDRDIVVELVSREKNSPRRESDISYTFTIIADANSADEYITPDDEEYDIDEGERVSVQCDGTIKNCRLFISDLAYMDIRARDGDVLTFHLDYDDDDPDVTDRAPSNAVLTYYNFKTSPTFRQSTRVGLLADDGQKYVYSISSSSKLTAVTASMRGDYLTFNTTKLGYYVISDRKLSASGNAASESSEESSEYYSESSIYVGTLIEKSTLKKAYSETASGSTVVLRIDNDSEVKLADLKSVSASYPNRSLCVVHRYDGKTVYQYRLNASQVAAMKGADSDGLISLGMTFGDEDATSLFQSYFTNNLYAMMHNNGATTGVNGSFAVYMGTNDLAHKNLKVYWYDPIRNYYEAIQTTVTIDKNNYAYFTAPVGYGVIMTEGALVKR